MQRTRIAFFQMVGAVHHAPEIDAVKQAEHVGRLVNEDLAASSQQDFFVVAAAFGAVEGRVIAGEAVDSDTAA